MISKGLEKKRLYSRKIINCVFCTVDIITFIFKLYKSKRIPEKYFFKMMYNSMINLNLFFLESPTTIKKSKMIIYIIKYHALPKRRECKSSSIFVHCLKLRNEFAFRTALKVLCYVYYYYTHIHTKYPSFHLNIYK